MSTEMTWPISRIPASESSAAEENSILRLRVMEMWDAWTNGKEPPSAIPGFPELSPRSTGTSNVPISHPNVSPGQPTISAHYVGGTSEVRPQVLMPGTAPNIFTAPACSATIQPSLPKPAFDPWVFPFQKPVFQADPPYPAYAYPHPPSYEITPGQDQTPKAPEQDEKYDGRGNLIAHSKKYCNPLCGAGGKEELLMDFENGRILGKTAIRATSQAIQGGSGGMAKNRTREEATMAASGGRRYRAERTPQHYYPHADMICAPPPYAVMNAQPFGRPQPPANRNLPQFQRNRPPYQNQYNPRPPQNNFPPRKLPRRQTFTPIGEPYSDLYPKLVQMGFLQPVPQTKQNPASPGYRAGVRCAYHSGAEGHDTNDCWTLKRAVENLIEQGKIVLKDEEVPNVTNNPLPAHNNRPIIGIICEDREFDPALKAIIAIADAERKPKVSPKQEKGEKKSKITKTEPEKETDVPKQAYVVWGTIKPPRLNEPVVIRRIPQKPEYSKEEDDEIFTAEEGEGICGAMRKVLCETHMVQPGEDTSTAGVLYMGPSAKFQNWKAMPFLIKREPQ